MDAKQQICSYLESDLGPQKRRFTYYLEAIYLKFFSIPWQSAPRKVGPAGDLLVSRVAILLMSLFSRFQHSA